MTEELQLLRDIVTRLDMAEIDYMLTDVENLIATGCDADYLRTWSAALNLTDTLTRVLP